MKRREFDWTEIAPSTVVIELLAEESGQDPTELDPLYETINPAALDQLIRGNSANPHDHTVSVSFSYNEYTVVIQSGGLVELSLDACCSNEVGIAPKRRSHESPD